MSTEVKRRRGSSSEMALFTPALGEIVVNTDDYSLVVGDGATVGGLSKKVYPASESTLIALSARVISDITSVYLDLDGRSGTFTYDANITAGTIATDPLQGVYVSSDFGGAWVRRYDNEVMLKWFGAVMDGTDEATIVQAADSFTATQEVKTLRLNGPLLGIGSKVSRSTKTNWLGSAGGKSAEQDTGVQILPLYDGILVECDGDTGTVYCRNLETKGIHWVGNPNTYPNAIAMRDRLVRQRVYEGTITGFAVGHQTVSCGEMYRDRMFISGCNLSTDDTSLADSWSEECHVGSGNAKVGADNAISAGGTGFKVRGGGNLTYDSCRLQVQDAGFGSEFINCTKLNIDNCFGDQNDKAALLLQGCSDVDIGTFKAFDNGLSGTKSGSIILRTLTETITASGAVISVDPNTDLRFASLVKVVTDGTLPAGLLADTIYYVANLGSGSLRFYLTRADLNASTNVVTTTDAGTGTHSLYGYCGDIRIIGGSSADRNGGLYQSYAIGFQQVGDANSALARFGPILLDGHSVEEVVTQMSNETLVRDSLRVRGLITGLADWEEVNGAAAVKTFLRSPNVSIRTAVDSVDRTFTIETDNITRGASWKFMRASTATGTWNWNIIYDSVTIATLSNAGDSAEVLFNGTSFAQVQ